ncbi:MAG: hypothetical protein INQ03_14070 [Candidatus Heimdallarchaeota archaeon]|nr:hypothetical protein [Candidatus Heimdallarchaeota archaeon]
MDEFSHLYAINLSSHGTLYLLSWNLSKKGGQGETYYAFKWSESTLPIWLKKNQLDMFISESVEVAYETALNSYRSYLRGDIRMLPAIIMTLATISIGLSVFTTNFIYNPIFIWFANLFGSENDIATEEVYYSQEDYEETINSGGRRIDPSEPN